MHIHTCMHTCCRLLYSLLWGNTHNISVAYRFCEKILIRTHY